MGLSKQFTELMHTSITAGGASERKILEYEKRLGLKFPNQYRQFLQTYGAALVIGKEICGIYPALKTGDTPLWSDVESDTTNLRENLVSGSYANAVAISHNGYGGYFFLRNYFSTDTTVMFIEYGEIKELEESFEEIFVTDSEYFD